MLNISIKTNSYVIFGSAFLCASYAQAAEFPNIKELIAFARSKPGGVSYGSSGVGTGPHLAAALLASMAKVQMTHVPTKASRPQ